MYLRQHNKKVDGELFNTSFDFFFYDIASTYFKDTVNGNSQAKGDIAGTVVPPLFLLSL